MSKCALSGRPCPQTSDRAAKVFCPAWAEDGLAWENVQTGEVRMQHCGVDALMPALKEVIKASNRPAAAIEDTRNEIAKQLQQGFGTLVQALPLLTQD